MASMEIAVDTATLSRDIEELRTAVKNARGQLKDMFEQVAALDAMWDGPANDAFRQVFGNDYENAKNMCATIDSLLASMENARKQYDQCENEVDGIVSAISI